MHFWSEFRNKLYRVMDKYGIVIAGIVIFAYYLWETLDMFASSNVRRSFEGYFFQFDSLILLWLLLFVGAKLHEHKKKLKEDREKDRQLILEYERQKIKIDMLDEVSRLLKDAINNPLAVISLSTGSIRQRFTTDSDILNYLDRIDGALKGMQEVLSDFQLYEMKKIIRSSQNTPPQESTNRGDRTVRSSAPLPAAH